MQTAKNLIRLGGYPGRSEFSLGALDNLLVLSRGGTVMLHSSHFQRHDIFRVIRYFQTQIFQCSVAKIFIEPGPSISYKTACTPSKDPDQPAHPHFGSLATHRVSCNENSDQTARMRRLVCIFAGCTCNIVGNAVSRFSCFVPLDLLD